MNKINWTKVLPHVVVLGILLIFSMIYLYPAFDNTLETHDINMYKGMSKELKDFREQTGEEALWTGAAFGGMPADQISIMKDSNLMKYVYSAITFGLPGPIATLWLLLLGFYVLLMCLKVDPLIALVGAIGFGLSSNFLISMQAGHMTKVKAIAFMPAVLGGFIYTFKGNYIKGSVIFTFFFAMQWWANHPQISYYTMIVLAIIGVFFLAEYLFEKKYKDLAKRVGVLAACSVLAMFTSLPSLWGTYEYSKHTIRGENFLNMKSPMDLYKDSTAEKKSGLSDDYILAWSYGTGETFTFMFPSLKGGGNNDMELKNLQTLFPSRAEQLTMSMQSDLETMSLDEALLSIPPEFQMPILNLQELPATKERGYYGQQGSTNGPVFIGVLLCLMALLSLVFSDGKLNWFLFGTVVFTILFAYLQMAAIVLLMFVVLLILSALNRRIIWFITISTLMTVMLAWGKNFIGFSELFIDYFPMYSKFRAVTMILAVSNVLIPLMGVLFISKVISEREKVKENLIRLYIGCGVLGFATLIIWLNPESAFNVPDELSSTAEMYKNYVGQILGGLGQAEQSIMESGQQVPPYITQYFKTFPQSQGQFMPQVDQYFAAYQSNLRELRVGIIKDDALKAFGFIAVFFLLVFFFVREKISKYVLIGGLGVLLLVDLVPVDLKYLNNKKDEAGDYYYWKSNDESANSFMAFDGDLKIYEYEKQSNPWLEDSVKVALSQANSISDLPLDLNGQNTLKLAVLNRNSNFRVANANFQSLSGESRTSYFYKSLGGYHGAKLRRIQDILDFAFFHPGVGQFLTQSGVPFVELDQDQILNMMNVKYLVNYSYNDNNKIDGVSPQPNPNALGAAWIVDEVKFVESADDEIKAMSKGSGFDAANVAILDKSFEELITSEGRASDASVSLLSYAPNKLEYEFSSSEDETVIFSEVFYPHGWQAYIDDQPAPYFRANYVLRGMSVPSGKHKITFKYDVPAYSAGGVVSLLTSTLVLLLVLSLLYLIYKDHPLVKDNESEELIL